MQTNLPTSSSTDKNFEGSAPSNGLTSSNGSDLDLLFVYPEKTLTLSVTGRACALDCSHCGGHYLEQMRTPEDIDPEIIVAKGYTSVLVSGGCDLDGSVPLLPHLGLIRKLSAHLPILAHTGLIDTQANAEILDNISAISLDMVGDNRIISEVYGLAGAKTVENFENTYLELSKSKLVYPHLTIGLYGGQLLGERRVLEFLVGHPPPALVLNVFIPTPGTKFQDRSPPPLNDVMDIAKLARTLLPDVPLYLGCMRPGGAYRRSLDVEAVNLGFKRIVHPTKEARERAIELGLKTGRMKKCCIM